MFRGFNSSWEISISKERNVDRFPDVASAFCSCQTHHVSQGLNSILPFCRDRKIFCSCVIRIIPTSALTTKPSTCAFQLSVAFVPRKKPTKCVFLVAYVCFDHTNITLLFHTQRKAQCFGRSLFCVAVLEVGSSARFRTVLHFSNCKQFPGALRFALHNGVVSVRINALKNLHFYLEWIYVPCPSLFPGFNVALDRSTKST